MKNMIYIIRKLNIRLIIAVLTVLLALTVCVTAPDVYADEESQGDTGSSQSADQLRSSLSDVQNSLNTAQGEYDKAAADLKALESQIATLEAQIKQTEGDIATLQAQIDDYHAQLDDLTKQIAELDKEVADQTDALNQRLRVMYMTGDDSMLSVLLGSTDLVDFMSNLDMVRRVHESDQAFLADLESKLNQVEQKKAEVQDIEAKLQEQQDTLQARKDQLDSDNAKLAVAKKSAQAIRDAAAAEVTRLEQESKRIEQELVNMTSQWGDYAGGKMAWPVIGPVTSEFGMRIHPITGQYTMHTGIDIGVPMGTPVHAAADGVIYFSGWNTGGYGYLVMIDNGTENGKSIVTMYGHNSQLLVKAGEVVHRGDVISLAGSTGNSTGPHVHFEVRVNGTPQNPRLWLG